MGVVVGGVGGARPPGAAEVAVAPRRACGAWVGLAPPPSPSPGVRRVTEPEAAGEVAISSGS